jgi:glycosyltransferase involved in cell wall biosynthesis
MARIAILWTQWSGYLEACYRALVAHENVQCFVCHQRPASASPFDIERFSKKQNVLVYGEKPDGAALEMALSEFEPDLLVICSWHIAAYRQAARSWKAKSLRMLCMDNQWHGTAKQYLGIAAFRTVWRSLYDYAFVPGPRQFCYARLLGFPAERIRLGMYAADVDAFAVTETAQQTPSFLFVGRDTPDKGLDQLVLAYSAYRNLVPQPWDLVLVGAHKAARQLPGVRSTGFVQPHDLPKLFSTATALVLPSTFEPHGLVVHEAAAAGLIIICSTEVGAGDLFVREGCNGTIFASRSVAELTSALHAVHGWSEAKRRDAFTLSRQLARQFTPSTWASGLVELVSRRKSGQYSV